MPATNKKIIYLVAAFLALPIWTEAKTSSHEYVDPFIGSQGLGNVFVGPSNPFGMVKPGPDIGTASNSGYDPDLSKPLHGFSQLHVSGTGGGPKYGNISLMPFVGDESNFHATSLRENERAKLGYYAVDLFNSQVSVELATANRASFHRYRFDTNEVHGIKVDGGFFLGEKPVPDAREAQQFVGSQVEVVSPTQVKGYSRIRGGWNNGKAYTVYYFAEFDQACSRLLTFVDNDISQQTRQIDLGRKTGAVCLFDKGKTHTVNVRVGISFISEEKAEHNLRTEIDHWQLKQVIQHTQSLWQPLFDKITLAKSASKEQKTMFYTGLYHTMLMPVDRSGENPLWNATPYYDDFYAIWDTFRTSSPLLTLIDPKRQAEIIQAMLNIYQYDGYLPEGRSGNSNGRTQGGSNADVVIADAFVKGLPGVNYHAALKAMLKNATVPPGGNAEHAGRGGLEDYNRLGYVSTDFVRSGNRTLEYAYNDFAIATVARGLGRNGEYYRFKKQSENWLNLWRDIEHDGTSGFIMPKDSQGNWVESITCTTKNGRVDKVEYTPVAQDWPNCVCWWCGFFYEASSWEYSFYVPHNVQGLIEQVGGAKDFEARLNRLFEGEYYNVANEPSFLTPTLYHWIGKPHLSSLRLHDIVNKHYSDKPDGLPGNDDSGAMSSWLVFNMIGLFPNAGQSYYLINTPHVPEVSLSLPDGKAFSIKTEGKITPTSVIVSASLNGKPYTKSYIEHQDILAGGTLTLTLGKRPGKWGSGELPPSNYIPNTPH